MSQHGSFKTGGRTKSKRNVLKRFERIERLKKESKWKEGDKVLGLPKSKREE